MAEKKKRSTQQWGLVDEEAPPPSSTTGKRSFNAGEARGLAAFDKGAGAPKKPAGPSHDHDDDDLRKARMEPSAEPSDDGMVETSRSFWGENAAPPVKGKKGRAAAREDDGEEGAPERKRSSAWKWIVLTLVLAGGGVGAWFGVNAMQRGSAPASEAGATDAKPAPKPTTAEDEAVEDEEPAATEPKAAAADATAGASDGGQADAQVAAKTEKPTAEMNVSEPAAWAAAVEASNPWVAVAAAPAGHLLGLSAAEAGDARARTGLRPEAKVTAPEKAYRIQPHEVTWGEIAKAESIPEAATFARPKWLPSDAGRQAKLPATGVPWSVAAAFCRGLGGDLPSEAEWEWAARGPDNRYLPWGRDAFGTNEVHTVAEGAVPVVAVKTSKLDRTPGQPIFDLLGNAQEWTRDSWRPSDPAAPADARSATHKVIRGWPLADPGVPIPAEGATYRGAGCAAAACMAAEGAALERVGFRCVRGGG